MKKYLHFFLPFLIIFLFSFIPLTWFSDNLLILGGDVAWPFIPHEQVIRALFVWDDKVGSGFINPLVIASLFPYYLLLWILEILKFPIIDMQKVTYFSLFFVSGLSMFLLVKKITGRNLSSIMASLIYMFNPYNLVWWSAPDPPPLIAFATFPLLILVFINGMESNRLLKPAIFFGLISLFFAPGGSNLTYPVLLFMTLFLILIFESVFEIFINKNKRTFFQKVKFTCISGIIFILFNFWWILPAISFQSEGRAHWVQQNPLGNLTSQSQKAQFINLFRLFGYPGWEAIFKTENLKVKPVSDYELATSKELNIKGGFPASLDYNKNKILIVISFIPLLIILAGFFRKKKPKYIYFFLSFWLISLFFSKGNNPPFSKIYETLYLNLPFFSIFRDPYHKFGVLLTLCFSVLFGYGAFVISDYFSLKKSLKRLLILSMFLVFIILNWPFWTNNVVHNERGATIPFHAKIPDTYFEAANWLNDQKGSFRVDSLPPHGIWTVYDWPYLGVDPLRMLSGKAQITEGGGSIIAQTFWDNVHSEVRKGETEFISKLAGLGQIGYFLIHKDSLWQWYGKENPKVISDKLEKQKDLSLVKSFDKLDFFKVENPSPLVYIPSEIIYSTNNSKSLVDIVSLDDFSPRSAVYFSKKTGFESEKENKFYLQNANRVIITGELIDGKEVEKIYFPSAYVRIPPDSILYPYILSKEEKALELAANQLDKIKLLMTLTDKRIVELNNLESRKSFRNFPKVIDRYLKLSEELIVQAGILVSQNDEEMLPYLRLIQEGINSQKKAITDSFHGRIDEAVFSKILSKIRENTSIIHDLEEEIIGRERVNYLLYVPEKGNYELLVKDEKFGKYFPSTNKLGITVDGRNFQELPLLNKGSSWLSLGEIHINQGKQRLGIRKPNVLNQSQIDKTQEIYLGSGKQTRFEKKITGLDPNFLYRISLSYQVPKGIASTLEISQDNDPVIEEEVKPTIRTDLPYNDKSRTHWTYFESEFKTNYNSKETKVQFSLDKSSVYSENIIKDITVEKVFKPKIMLMKKKSNLDINLPQLTFTKINPTRLNVEINNAKKPFFLIFLDSFHSDWKIYENKENTSDGPRNIVASYFNDAVREKEPTSNFFPKDELILWGQRPLFENGHFLINDYANLWYIDKQGSFSLIINFWSQRLFYWGIIISGVTVFCSLVYLLVTKIWSRN